MSLELNPLPLQQRVQAMSNKDFDYNYYKEQYTPAELQILEAITDILFDVTYAKLGSKTAARRKAAQDILSAVKTAYIIHTSGNDLRLDDPEATTTATNTSPNQSP